jgi:signal transduction histidine kinase
MLRGVPGALLAAAPLLALTLAAALWTARLGDQRAEQELRALALSARELVDHRISAYRETLIGASGLRGASSTVTRAEYHDYVERLGIRDRYPGIQVMGFAELVPGADRGRYEIAADRDAAAAGLGYPQLRISPTDRRAEYLPIGYVEPLAGNEAALGFDFLSEPARRAAAVRARDTGAPAATAPVTLVQETGSQTGFLIMVPSYRADQPATTVEQRRAAFVGVEYAAFRMDDLMRGVLGADARQDLLALYDLGLVTDPIPMTGDRRTFFAGQPAGTPAGPAVVLPLEVGGRQWAIRYHPALPLESSLERSAPLVIAVLGLLLSALTAWLFWAVSTARTRAVGLAGQMTTRLRASEQKLARSNAELERFAYVASHDLQEPLRTVASFVSLLDRRYADRLDDQGRRYIKFAVDGARRMSELIEELLAFSRLGHADEPPAPTDLGAAWDEAVANLRGQIDETGAEVSRTALPVVLAGHREAVQLLQNLIGNGLKYRGEDRPVITAGAERDGPDWRITVRDNGIGIDPAYHERIFVVFKRLHTADEYPGTGMGLAICKKIVDGYGGSIAVASAPGAGAAFTATLPAGEG